MFSDARFSGFVEFSPSFSPRPKISHVIFWISMGRFPGCGMAGRRSWWELFRPHLKVQPGESEEAIHEMLLGDFLSLNVGNRPFTK